MVVDRAELTGALRAAGCVFAEEEARLLLAEGRDEQELAALVARREAGEPLEHVLGWAQFGGLRIVVEPGVFVPRRRTEFLVAQAVGVTAPGSVVVDLCCGSGALGAAVAHEVGDVRLHACDIDPVAVRCAARNIGGNVYQGDLFDPLPRELRGRVDLILANVPYVPTSEVELMPPEARLHEAKVALDGGHDGLDVLRRVAAETPEWLAPNGHLFVESSVDQAPLMVSVLNRRGLVARAVTSEDLEATVVLAGPNRLSASRPR